MNSNQNITIVSLIHPGGSTKWYNHAGRQSASSPVSDGVTFAQPSDTPVAGVHPQWNKHLRSPQNYVWTFTESSICDHQKYQRPPRRSAASKWVPGVGSRVMEYHVATERSTAGACNNVNTSQRHELHEKVSFKRLHIVPWLVWLSGWSASLRTKGSTVRFPSQSSCLDCELGPQ